MCTSSLPFAPDPPCKQWQLRADQAYYLSPSSTCICIWSCVCICIYVFIYPGLPHNSAGPTVLQRLSRMLGEAWGSSHQSHRDRDWEPLRTKLGSQLLCSMWRGQGIHSVFFGPYLQCFFGPIALRQRWLKGIALRAEFLIAAFHLLTPRVDSHRWCWDISQVLIIFVISVQMQTISKVFL